MRGKNFLDLVLTPCAGKARLLPKIGSSDHYYAVLATLDLSSLKAEEPVPGRKLYHWSLANWREMNVELSRNCFDFENLSVQESVDLLTNTLKELTDKYVPSSTPPKGKPLPWWTPESEWALRRKQRAFQGGNKKAIMWATKSYTAAINF